MRRLGQGVAILAAFMLHSAPSRAQGNPDVKYWPLREINFPVPLDRLNVMNPRPSKLRFYAARDRGRYDLVAEKGIDDLELIDRDRNLRGFRYTTPADGEYDFAMQLAFPDGDVSPSNADLAPHYRIIVDTVPPLIRLEPLGNSGIRWNVEERNPDPDGVKLEVRWQGSTKWLPISPRPLGLNDRYIWQGLSPNKPLEVRLVVKDRAGLEMASRPMTLPASGNGVEPAEIDYGDSYGVSNRPQIDFVNTVNLTIASKLTRVTRSGVKAAELWVNEGKTGWRKYQEEILTQPISPNSPDPTIRMKYTAPNDGLYGFIVIPVNGAGGKQDDPRPNDPAQILVEVDTELPYIKIKGVRVSPGGAIGPRVEIEWDAKDKNPMPEPVVLSYSENPNAPDSAWKLITPSPIADTGRYVWEVEDKNLWRFYVRASFVDKASNRSVDVYGKEVIIDLETPAAVIHRVESTVAPAGPRPKVSPAAPATTPPVSRPAPPPPSRPPVSVPDSVPSQPPPLTAPPPLISPSKASPLTP
mgnify:CR=1 FL=1